LEMANSGSRGGVGRRKSRVGDGPREAPCGLLERCIPGEEGRVIAKKREKKKEGRKGEKRV